MQFLINVHPNTQKSANSKESPDSSETKNGNDRVAATHTLLNRNPKSSQKSVSKRNKNMRISDFSYLSPFETIFTQSLNVSIE